MATLEEIDAPPAVAADSSDVTQVAAAAVSEAATAAGVAVSGGGELDPELNTDFQVNPAYTTSKEIKEDQAEVARGAKKDKTQSIKSAVIISGVVVAVLGAICAVAKKLKGARH